MARVNFPLLTFQDLDGTPLSSGYTLISLSSDAQSPAGQICGGLTLRVPLDSNGTMTFTPQVYANSDLSPSDTTYVLEAYNSSGLRVLGPKAVTV
jgi:hypothetical protein